MTRKFKSENLFWGKFSDNSWQFSVKKRATKLRLEGKFDSSNPRYRRYACIFLIEIIEIIEINARLRNILDIKQISTLVYRKISIISIISIKNGHTL